MESNKIEEQARQQYKSIDQSQVGNLVMNAERTAFKKGAEWAIRELEPKWNDASKILPSEGGRYWCYAKELNDGGWWSHYQWNCSYNESTKEWDDTDGNTVTHWTSLLPAPKED